MKAFLDEIIQGEEKDRGSVTFYISRSLFQEFQKVCDRPSRVVETFMRECIRRARRQAKKASAKKQEVA